MCLYPRLIRNPKYLPNKKNGGYAPIPSDNRARWVAIGCGECIECKQKKSREWRVRLSEEFKENSNCNFVTLTFSEKKLFKYRQLAHEEIDNENKLYCDIYEIDNIAAKIAIRHMLERYRKKTGKSIKHWLITERGHQNTRRVHIHGLLWTTFEQEGRGKNGKYDLNKLWNNGWCFNGSYVGQKTITYISKYITKHDKDNEGFHGKIMTSAGIGKRYIHSRSVNRNKYDGKRTCTTYQLNNGQEIDLPMYYRNKIYTEREREKLWMQLLDKQERWVLGVKTDISMGLERYENLVSIGRMISQNAGYPVPEWTTEEYKKAYIGKMILINRNNNVLLQNNLNQKEYGDEKTTRNPYADELLAIRGQEKNNGDDISPTRRLYTGKGVWIREVENERLGNATSGCLTNDRQRSTGIIPGDTKRLPTTSNMLKTINHEQRTRRTTDIDPNQAIQGNVKASTRNGCTEQREREIVGDDNRSRYECIDIESGEIFHKPEYGKTYKTISYEKRCQKVTRPDGSKSKIWHTIRFVQEVGYEQLELFK